MGGEAAHDLGHVPVAEAHLELALDQPVAFEHQHAAALEQRLRRHAQHVVACAQDHLGVSGRARQQSGCDRGVVELELDLERAVLLEAVEHVGRDLDDPGGKVLSGLRVHGDTSRLALLDASRVHLVHRRAHVDRARVDQVEHGRDRQRRGRGGRPLALLDEGVGHDAVEGCPQHGLVELRLREGHRGPRALHRRGGGPAGGFGRSRLALDAIVPVVGDEAVLREPLRALAVTAGPLGHQARLLALRAGRLLLVLGEPQPRPLERVVHPQQQLALPHARAAAARQRQHPAADLGRELGPTPGLDRTGPGVGDRLLDAPFLDRPRPGRGSPRARRASRGAEPRQPPPQRRAPLGSRPAGSTCRTPLSLNVTNSMFFSPRLCAPDTEGSGAVAPCACIASDGRCAMRANFDAPIGPAPPMSSASWFPSPGPDRLRDPDCAPARRCALRSRRWHEDSTTACWSSVSGRRLGWLAARYRRPACRR